jgi:multicomponent Na+:H+ antiporter subunit D
MTDALIAAPVWVPLATAIIAMLAGPARGRLVSLTGAALLLGSAVWLMFRVWTDGIQVLEVGGWQAPFGIALVVDHFSATMVLVTAVVATAVLWYSLDDIDAALERRGFYPLVHVLLMGVCGSFVTGDLFNLYVWLEVMLIASFALLTLGREPEQLRGGFIYVVINLVSSVLFLTAVGAIYGATGTLNLAALARMTPQLDPDTLNLLAVMLLAAFGIKAGLFPLFFWLPDSYHAPPAAIGRTQRRPWPFAPSSRSSSCC